jgi:hypothetical protein
VVERVAVSSSAVRRAVILGVLSVASCRAEIEQCPAGAFGCPCAPGGECNAGFECAEDGRCRDDEPIGTDSESSSSSSTTMVSSSGSGETFDPTSSSTTDGTTFNETTGALPCVCGWSDTQQLYTCGEGLPPIGPPGLGMPDCGSEGFLVGDVCTSVDPPITAYGCCRPVDMLAFCHPKTQTIVLQQCLFTEFGCVPASY